jgi:hypothetical protein
MFGESGALENLHLVSSVDAVDARKIISVVELERAPARAARTLISWMERQRRMPSASCASAITDLCSHPLIVHRTSDNDELFCEIRMMRASAIVVAQNAIVACDLQEFVGIDDAT